MNRRTGSFVRRLPAQLAFLFFCLYAGAQDNVAAQFANYPFLLRLEHTTGKSKVCVLLRRDGDFHLEHTQSDDTLVSEGQISQSELLKLKQTLDSDELQKLSQEKIVPPLLYSMNGQLQVNVFRTDHWQSLLFPDATSQVSFIQTLKPLVTWLNTLHSEPHREVSEDAGKNNCLPPKELKLTIRVGESAVPAADAVSTVTPAASGKPQFNQPNPFLMRYSRDRVSNGNLDRTCVIVNPSGRYRMEIGNQPATFKMKTAVFEGSITDDQLKELVQLLDAPDLKTLHHQNRIAGVTVVDADVVSLAIPREDETQQLIFSGYVGTRPHNKGPIPNVTDDTTSVEPVQNWLETAIVSKKLEPVKSVPPDNCATAP
ncbi:MAG TPA: hypothetical protein VH079_10525 [Terriglobales bacterium]|nr:hypothetical protein [Terriglobales bacterium]